jgi:hypothetical protein
MLEQDQNLMRNDQCDYINDFLKRFNCRGHPDIWLDSRINDYVIDSIIR